MNCKKCSFSTDKKSDLLNHYRWIHRENYFNDIALENGNQKKRNALDLKLGAKLTKEFKCLNCEKTFEVTEREKSKKKKGRYCSRSCANVRSHSIETKKLISKNTSIGIKKYLDENPDVILNVGKKRFNSKSELEILNLLKEKYSDLKWKSGSILKIEDERIVRDMWSDERKICIEYDGIWHFKDIHNQLALKEKKDKLLNNWCRDHNYCLIRIDEKLFNENRTLIYDEIFRIIENTLDFGIHFLYHVDKVKKYC